MRNTTDNPLHSILEQWWPMQQAELLSLSAIDADCVEQIVMDELIAMRGDPDNVMLRAGRFPQSCLITVSNKCQSAPPEDKRQCAVRVCELLAVCLLYQGGKEQKDASAVLLAKADDLTTRRNLWPNLEESIEAVGAARLQHWVKSFWQESGEEEIETYQQHKKQMNKDEILKAIAAGASIDKLIVGDYVQGDKHEYQAGAQVTQHFHGSAPSRENGGELELTERQQELFDHAADAGLLEKTADGYEWKKNQALLAYFVGRVFCGDKPQKNSEGKPMWDSGGPQLPAAALEKMFGTRGFAEYRNKQLLKGLPQNHKLVDNLF